MAGLIESGRVADFILLLVVVEAIGLVYFYRRTGHGVRPLDLLINLAAGATLILALRAALVDAGWQAVAFFLALAGLAHLGDLVRRWR
ncbi:putative membrane protein [Rhodopseudomonas julia]|uniref:Membrane protein n=1 Tax=Rhodopseudomonas julia TaxID=200617 RepID=A0ABU0CBS9_9BRAD|nr:hypothetical protein [Rhodopseudomonas julia]MDQ0327381.1 putative membrane protein [Rhodopseudomonas julia]